MIRGQGLGLVTRGSITRRYTASIALFFIPPISPLRAEHPLERVTRIMILIPIECVYSSKPLAISGSGGPHELYTGILMCLALYEQFPPPLPSPDDHPPHTMPNRAKNEKRDTKLSKGKVR